MRTLWLIGILFPLAPIAAPTAIIVSGDSIGWAKTICPSDPTWSELLETTLRTSDDSVRVVNIAKDATQMLAIRRRWEQATRALEADPFPYRITILEGGTNNLAIGGLGVDVWSEFETQAEEANAAGHSVVFFSIPPRGNSAGWTGGTETERLFVNSQAETYAGTHAWFRYVDMDAVLGGGGDPLELSPTCDAGDGLHPSCACQDEIASAIGAAISSL